MCPLRDELLYRESTTCIDYSDPLCSQKQIIPK